MLVRSIGMIAGGSSGLDKHQLGSAARNQKFADSTGGGGSQLRVVISIKGFDSPFCQDDHTRLGGWSQHDRSAETRILAVMIN
jgi:hypothetical protein